MPAAPAAIAAVLAVLGARAGDPSVPALPARAGEVAVDEVLATVEGAPILKSEVDRRFDELGGRVSRGTIVRQLVVSKVFLARAKEAEITIPDARVDEAMAERVAALGGAAAYRERLAERGVGFEDDRVSVRDALLVEEYVRHALGRVRGSPHLLPHLARRIHVTPREMQEHFREHRDQYRLEARTEIGRLLVPKAAFADEADARSRAAALRQAALSDPSSLRAAAEADPRLRYAEVTLDSAERDALRDDLRRALDAAPVSGPTAVIETDGAFLVVLKRAEVKPRLLTFEEAQPIVFGFLTETEEREARVALARELLADAEVWPEGLFAQEVPVGQDVAPDPPPP